MKVEKTVPKTEYTIEPGKQDLTSTVILDAPRELVFKCYTDPELFVRWWGPSRYRNDVEKYDSRSGGEWKVTQVGDDGSRHAFRGVNHEVAAPERICQTFEYLGFPGHVALQTATFEALGNKTKIVAQIVFQSVMDRDGMVASGMRSGADESMERLQDLLDTLKSGK
ncbi:MAG TPA: SRPBCC family protein [Candidatus Dormibacteraeota bacterium]|nr:SRPBCC family protein [Candidatus Dormibacteraeota bacterium]